MAMFEVYDAETGEHINGEFLLNQDGYLYRFQFPKTTYNAEWITGSVVRINPEEKYIIQFIGTHERIMRY